MFTNRLSTLVIVIVIAALALVTASFTTSPRNSESYQDYAQRHPGGLVLSSASSIGNQSPDYYQRHRAEFKSALLLDASDYFMRHPELKGTRSVDTTDYFFRRAAQ